MKTFKTILILSIILISSIFTISFITKEPLSNADEYDVLEVLTSQHLYITDVDHVMNTEGDTTTNIKAELQDDFMILRYSKNAVDTLVDWTPCEKKGCPETGQYPMNSTYANELLQIVQQTSKK